MVEKGDVVTVMKGTHKGKTGKVTKILRVFINIQFEHGSAGRTLPSSVKMNKPEIEASDKEVGKKHIEVTVNERSDNALENYRELSVAVLTEMLAQGMALSGKQSEKQLEIEMKTLFDRIKEIRRGL